jgi:outer membrane immunogenic protein
MKKILVGIALSALAAGSAMAADMPVKARPAPAVVAVYSWTGFYIGANGGWGWSDLDFLTAAGTDISHKGKGPVIGGQIGYNFQVANNFVLGVEVDADYANITGQVSCPNAAFNCRHQLSALVSARGRIGYLVTPQALLYGTGGGAWTRVRYDAVSVATGLANPGGFVTRDDHTGWVAGGGLEYKFANSWSVRAEYLYYAFDKKTLDCTPLGGAAANCNFEPTVHTVRVGFNWHFNVPSAVVARY